MTFYAISALINALTSIVLGTLTLFAGWRNPVNQTFFIATVAVATWSFFYFMWQLAVDHDAALFWVHVLMIGSILISPTYFHFICTLLNVAWKMRAWIVVGYAQAAFFLVLNWTDLFIPDVIPKGGFAYWPEPGPLYHVFLIISWAYIIAAAIMLYRAMRHSAEGERGRLRFVFIATLIGYIGGYTNYFLWYDIPIPPFANISTTIYIALTAFAIMRHKLFNMKVIATELLIFSLWLFIFIRLLLSDSVQAQVVDGVLLFVTLVVGALLIRSVDNEVEQRERIEVQEKELEIANQQQESLLHFISHEIKGYLAKNEAAFAGIVDGDFGKTEPALESMAKLALTDTRKGVATVMDILDASNLKKGTVAYNKKPFDIAASLEASMQSLKTAAQEKGIALEFAKPSAPILVNGDEAKIRDNVLRNVVDNSIKYTPSGSVHVVLEEMSEKARITVTDTGVGITPEDMQHLFTAGGHGKDSIHINVHSTGYGLYIAKSVLEAHGGTIRAESEGAGKGSRFIIELPLS